MAPNGRTTCRGSLSPIKPGRYRDSHPCTADFVAKVGEEPLGSKKCATIGSERMDFLISHPGTSAHFTCDVPITRQAADLLIALSGNFMAPERQLSAHPFPGNTTKRTNAP